MENPSAIHNVGTQLPPLKRFRKRAGRIWTRVLLISILGLSALIGVWFLGVRLSLHQQALVQFDRAWGGAESQTFEYLSTFPEGRPKNLLFNEKLLSHALNTYATDDSVRNWQVAVTPTNIRLSFTACGQNCPVTAILQVSKINEIQVTQVQVQGMFALIMSNEELRDALSNNLQRFSFSLTEFTVTKITLLEHAIDIHLY